MVDLNELAMFHQVVRTGSFAEAARRLGMPANSLSRRIQRLEAGLNVRLLQRTTRKLTLTDAGQELFERSAGPLDEALQATLRLLERSDGPSGVVRIAATADVFEFVPMTWISEFLSEQPRVRLDFVLSDELSDLTADGIDLAFRGGALKDSAFVARKLADSSLVLAAGPAYLAARGEPRQVQDLADHDCITSGRRGRTLWRIEGDRGEEVVEVRGRFGANTAQSQVRAARAGLGICFVPAVLAAAGFEDGSLLPVLPGRHQTAAGLYAVYPSRKHISRAAAAFLDMALKRYAEVVGRQAGGPQGPAGGLDSPRPRRD